MSGQVVNSTLPRSAPAVDRSTPIPLYYQLKQWLSERILSGDFAAGGRIPAEAELCGRFGLSRGVVRQAISELRYEGLVSSERGRGTFVSVPKTADGLMSGLGGLADDARLRGREVDSTVLLLREAPAGADVARRLQLDPGDAVVELERLRAIGGEPIVLVISYLPAALVPGLVAHDLNGSASLYQILRERYALPLVSSVRRVEATLADTREAHLLRIQRGAALLVLRSVSFTVGGRPFEYFIARHRGDRSTFEVQLRAATPAISRFEGLSLEADGRS